jgi:hypothetical protein
MAVKLGVTVAGAEIDDQEATRLSRELVGQAPGAADSALGPPRDIWQDVNGPRRWRSYPVKFDVLDEKRYIVGVEGQRIVLVELVQRHGSEADIPLELIYLAKVKGKSPEECRDALGFGAPLLTARSTMTGELAQLYDAGEIPSLSGRHHAIVRFDAQGLCRRLDLVTIK